MVVPPGGRNSGGAAPTEYSADVRAAPWDAASVAPGNYPAAAGSGFSIGTPMRLPYSVHEPS